MNDWWQRYLMQLYGGEADLADINNPNTPSVARPTPPAQFNNNDPIYGNAPKLPVEQGVTPPPNFFYPQFGSPTPSPTSTPGMFPPGMPPGQDLTPHSMVPDAGEPNYPGLVPGPANETFDLPTQDSPTDPGFGNSPFFTPMSPDMGNEVYGPTYGTDIYPDLRNAFQNYQDVPGAGGAPVAGPPIDDAFTSNQDFLPEQFLPQYQDYTNPDNGGTDWGAPPAVALGATDIWGGQVNMDWSGGPVESPYPNDPYANVPTAPGVEPDALPANPNTYLLGPGRFATGQPGMPGVPGTALSPQDEANIYNRGPITPLARQGILDQMRLPTNYPAVGQFFKDAAGNIVNAAGKIIAAAGDAAKSFADNIMNDPRNTDPAYLASMGYHEMDTGEMVPGGVTGPTIGAADIGAYGAGGGGGSYFHGGASAGLPHGATSVAGAGFGLGSFSGDASFIMDRLKGGRGVNLRGRLIKGQYMPNNFRPFSSMPTVSAAQFMAARNPSGAAGLTQNMQGSLRPVPTGIAQARNPGQPAHLPFRSPV